MKTSNGNFFTLIGILLVIAGLIILPDDSIIGFIGIILGIYNIIKGIRLLRGIQPMLIRKQQERHSDEKKELEQKLKESNTPTKKNKDNNDNN